MQRTYPDAGNVWRSRLALTRVSKYISEGKLLSQFSTVTTFDVPPKTLYKTSPYTSDSILFRQTTLLLLLLLLPGPALIHLDQLLPTEHRA